LLHTCLPSQFKYLLFTDVPAALFEQAANLAHCLYLRRGPDFPPDLCCWKYGELILPNESASSSFWGDKPQRHTHNSEEAPAEFSPTPLRAELGKATVNQGNSILDHSRQLGSSQVSYGRDPLTLATDITDANGKLATLYYSTQTNRTVPAASFISTGDRLRPLLSIAPLANGTARCAVGAEPAEYPSGVPLLCVPWTDRGCPFHWTKSLLLGTMC